MANQEFLGEFLSLPTEAQNQVVSLIASCYLEYRTLIDIVNDIWITGITSRRSDGLERTLQVCCISYVHQHVIGKTWCQA